MQREQTEPAEAVFHEGELALQCEAGAAERLARVAPQGIRAYMPDQHREFFALLPFILVGSVDAEHKPTASILCGAPGFISSPDAHTLQIDAVPCVGDPLNGNLKLDAPLGLLGIQGHTARRNRANGTVLHTDSGRFSVGITQSFGNCPKYIVPREALYVAGGQASNRVQTSVGFGPAERALMSNADTFYVASAHPGASASAPRAHGVDVSHRGGTPGFVQFTDDSTFVVPDFRGNNFYMTLGNLSLNSAAGLLFIDFETGGLLQLDATAEAFAGTHPFAGDRGTGRVVRFSVQHARFFPAACPLRFILHQR